MYVGLKQPRGDGERYVTPARAAAKETTVNPDLRLLEPISVPLVGQQNWDLFNCTYQTLSVYCE